MRREQARQGKPRNQAAQDLEAVGRRVWVLLDAAGLRIVRVEEVNS